MKTASWTIRFINRNDTALLFPIEDGFEILYREGGFGLNYVRGLGIILCWLGFFAALGLAAASFLSFPWPHSFRAPSCSWHAGNTLSSVVSEGGIMGADHESGALSGRRLISCCSLFSKLFCKSRPGAGLFARGLIQHRTQHYLGTIGPGFRSYCPPDGGYPGCSRDHSFSHAANWPPRKAPRR